MSVSYIKGGSVFMDGGFYERTIAMEDGRIFVLPKDFAPEAGAEVYDAAGRHVVPGFIDVHTHGAVGVDVNAASAEDLEKICRFVAGNGTTSWLCSILTDTEEQTFKCIDAFNAHAEMDQKGAHLLGNGLERDTGHHSAHYLPESRIGYQFFKNLRQLLVMIGANLIKFRIHIISD